MKKKAEYMFELVGIISIIKLTNTVSSLFSKLKKIKFS